MTEVKQFREIKLPVPWGHIAARTYGSSTGKPVLVLHGRLDNAGSFTRLMKYLPKELFYYVCIDLPGHGWSSPFPSWIMLDIMNYVHSLHFILEALQWKTCICIGHSMGAQIVSIFSGFQPNRIEKLISIDGIVANRFPRKKFAIYFKNASTFSVKAYCNEEPLSFTREQILNAMMTMRTGKLSSEAAEALFERAVTEVNGKYIYNRDIRLKNHPFSCFNMEDCYKLNEAVTVPIYLLLPSNGIFFPTKDPEDHKQSELLKSKSILEIIRINGSHDVHNNNPEIIAPFICKILNNEYSNKL